MTSEALSLTHDKVGFIGLGHMGKPLAKNLAAWLHKNNLPPLTVWSRTSTNLTALPASDAVVHAKTLKEVVEKCDVVFTSLASDDVVQSVYGELFEAARAKEEKRDKSVKGGKVQIFCETSTIYPSLSGQLERLAAQIPHTYYLQTPVFGPPDVAAEAKCLFVLSGDHQVKKHIQALVVPAMATRTIDVGANVERAAAFKLTGNLVTLGVIEVLAEAMTFAEKSGVGAELLMDFVKTFIPAPDMITYGTKIATNSYEGSTGFTVEGGLRDANHLRHLAASVDATIPVIDLAHRHLITSRANGGAELDWSSLVAGPRMAAGVLPFTGLKAQPHDTGFGSRVFGDEVEVPVPDGGIKTVQNFKD